MPSTHLQPAFSNLGCGPGALPVTERVAAELLTLPVYPGMLVGGVDLVIKHLRRLVAGG